MNKQQEKLIMRCAVLEKKLQEIIDKEKVLSVEFFFVMIKIITERLHDIMENMQYSSNEMKEFNERLLDASGKFGDLALDVLRLKEKKEEKKSSIIIN